MHGTMELTPAQREAVAHQDGPLLVVAGPGSGKTAVIAHRTATLLGSGVAPHNLLVVTFTRAAADEMQTRAAALTPAAHKVTFCTFHSLAYRILRASRPGPPPRILEEDQQFRLLRALLEHHQLPADEDAVLELQADLGRWANSADPETYQPQDLHPDDFRRLRAAYQAEKDRRGVMDFDDLQLQALADLRTRPELLQGLRNRYHYVMVDEFQDTNGAQWELLQLVAEPRRNVCVVGDDDQAIYGWRGGSPHYLLAFPRRFPGCRVVKLEVNHRCPAPVVAAAGRLIGHNRERFAKEIRPAGTAGARGPAPQVLHPADSMAEAEAVLDLLHRPNRPGRSWSDYAVLYRTHVQAHAVAQALDRAGIPYRALGGLPNLFRRWPVQDVLSYLRLAAGVGSMADLAQVVNRPGRYVRRSALAAAEQHWRAGAEPVQALLDCGALERWQAERIEELAGHLRRMRERTAPEAIAYTRRILGYDSYIEEFAGRKNGSAEELLGLLAELEITAPRVGLVEYLAQAEGYASRRGGGGGEQEPAVTLSTCHRAKGLEFPMVILIGAVDGLMPMRQNGELEEERRLFYVAMTRAAEELYISAPRAWEGKERKPSPFLAEAGLVGAAEAGSARAGAGTGRERIVPGAPVYHARHGRGEVESVDPVLDRLTVNFSGNRVSLDLNWCLNMPSFFRVLTGD